MPREPDKRECNRRKHTATNTFATPHMGHSLKHIHNHNTTTTVTTNTKQLLQDSKRRQPRIAANCMTCIVQLKQKARLTYLRFGWHGMNSGADKNSWAIGTGWGRLPR